MREYETVIVLKPEITEEQLRNFQTKVTEIIESQGGKIAFTDNWGKKKLGFEKDKYMKGIYLHVVYFGKGGLVSEFTRNLRIQENILLFQTITLNDKVLDFEGRFNEILQKRENPEYVLPYDHNNSFIEEYAQ